MFQYAIHRFKLFGVTALVATTGFLSGCGGGSDSPSEQSLSTTTTTAAAPLGNIVEVAKADPRFSILVEAVVAADLGATLSGAGPFTLFAPTNDAFVALLGELNLSKDQLLANKTLLTSVLTYHVLPAKVNKAQVVAGVANTTVQGGIFKIDAVGSDLVITDGRNRSAKIIQADIPAANGVIHVIDKVLLPANKNLLDTASALPQFSTLVEVIGAANLTGTLNGAGPFTVFAPTNDAFAALFVELRITKAEAIANPTLLAKVLTYHVLPGRVLKAEIPVNTPLKTLQGSTLKIDAGLVITDQLGRKSQITATDVLASNGVIHVIDKVISPLP
ncbi:fasciclin domain-containing protein [Actimicrobium antarcticum]|uniref:Fasciclin domain-containing protein n=1 Tax=Actimicrobium antarcticum TaxID=1051899 RepID=A0ABP7SKY5_9BURK